MRSLASFVSSVTLLAACGADPVVEEPGPDPEPEPMPGELSAIERCIAGGGALGVDYAVGNQHGAVTSIAVGGTTVVLASVDGSVKQWATNGTSPSYGAQFTPSGPLVAALAFTDGHLLAADATGSLQEWHAASSEPTRTLPVMTEALGVIGVDPTGAHVAVAAPDPSTAMRVVDRATGAVSAELTTNLWGVAALSLTNDQLITAGHWYGVPELERRALASPIERVDAYQFTERFGWIRATAIAGDKVLVAADDFVAIFALDDLAAGPIAITERAGHQPRGLALLRGGELFATAGAEGALHLWRVATAEHVAELASAPAIGIATDAAGDRLFTSGDDGMLRAFRCAP